MPLPALITDPSNPPKPEGFEVAGSPALLSFGVMGRSDSPLISTIWEVMGSRHSESEAARWLVAQFSTRKTVPLSAKNADFIALSVRFNPSLR
jgi:hypothetical protein